MFIQAMCVCLGEGGSSGGWTNPLVLRAYSWLQSRVTPDYACGVAVCVSLELGAAPR